MRSFSSSRAFALALVVLAPSVVAACGHTEQEWGYQLEKAARLRVEKDAADQRAAKAEREAADAKGKATALLAELETGSEFDSRTGKAAGPALAVPEGLAALEASGVRAFEAGDRVVIELPNKSLFAAGAPTLSADGKALLAKVGAALASAAGSGALRDAAFRVTVPALDGSSRDALDAALDRAREALLFLRGDQGGLPTVPWSAAASVATADEIKAAFAAAPPAPPKPKKGAKAKKTAGSKPLVGLALRIEIAPAPVPASGGRAPRPDDFDEPAPQPGPAPASPPITSPAPGAPATPLRGADPKAVPNEE